MKMNEIMNAVADTIEKNPRGFSMKSCHDSVAGTRDIAGWAVALNGNTKLLSQFEYPEIAHSSFGLPDEILFLSEWPAEFSDGYEKKNRMEQAKTAARLLRLVANS